MQTTTRTATHAVTHTTTNTSIRDWANQQLAKQAPVAAQRLQQHKPTKRTGRWRERLAAVLALTSVVFAIQFEQQLHTAMTDTINENMTNWLNVVTLNDPDSQPKPS